MAQKKTKYFLSKIIASFLTNGFINYLIHNIFFVTKIQSVKPRKIEEQGKPRLFFGTTPLLNNKYWSQALKKVGYKSETVMSGYYSSISKKEDFDLYFDEIIKTSGPRFLPDFIKNEFKRIILLNYVINNYDILHISFTGLFFQDTKFQEAELKLIKKAGIKIIVIPYGGDAYMYSKVINPTVRHGLLLSYPEKAKQETDIELNYSFWVKAADIIITAFMIDGCSKWDVLPASIITIDSDKWQIKSNYSNTDGHNGIVNIIHTPNHRGFKGTEFIIEAVKQLKEEGLKINLILLEKVKNDEVLRIMKEEGDILIEQLLIGYALSGIEGMATGLAVISNLENEEYTRLFRRFSYLNECPILSATPESIKERIKVLVENPELRKQLGLAGNQYVQKYHSEKTAQYIFEKVYDKIWFGKDVDLMNMFHPLKADSYNNQSPKIKHPLFENKIRPDYFNKTN